MTEGIAVADPVTVAWEESDLSVFPTRYGSSLAQKIGLSLSGPPSTGAIPTTPTPSQTARELVKDHLSTGAKAGIGVGVIITALFVGVGLVLFYLRKIRKKHITDVAEGLAEMADQDQHLANRKWFLQGKWRSEAEGNETLREIDSRTVHVVPGPPVELDSSGPHISGTDSRPYEIGGDRGNVNGV